MLFICVYFSTTVGIAQNAAAVELTFFDGSILRSDSISFQQNELYLFRVKKRSSSLDKRSFRVINSYEVFKLRQDGEETILYDPDYDELSVEEMSSLIAGRQLAISTFKKGNTIALGAASGFLIGVGTGSSLLAVSASFPSAFIYSNIPVNRKNKHLLDLPYEWDGYKKEIRQKRFIPFLFANLLGAVVGVTLAPLVLEQ